VKKNKREKKKNKKKKQRPDSPSLPRTERIVAQDHITYQAPDTETHTTKDQGSKDENEDPDILPDDEWEVSSPRKRKWWISVLLWVSFLLVLAGILIAFFLRKELKTSEYQARFFHQRSSRLVSSLEHGSAVPFQSSKGPYDQRLGYSNLHLYQNRLKDQGFRQITYTHVRDDTEFLKRFDLTFPYRAKTRSGLSVQGDNNTPLYSFKEPRWHFTEFSSISELVINTLLFIEDRSLLDMEHPRKNPAVEWDRFFKAISDLVIDKFVSRRKVPGGSTLATQMEKYRHSPGGRTSSPGDKIRQMISASLKAYHESEDTREYRKSVVLDYINSVPLAALPGYGEIHGLADGLWAYFGENPLEINEILSRPSDTLSPEELSRQARAYKQILSLFIAHRRPSDYLDENPARLLSHIDKYLPLLFREGIISYSLYQAALHEEVVYRRTLPPRDRSSFAARKGPSVVRTHLLSTLKTSSLYELDRLDLAVESTINTKVQEQVTEYLMGLLEKDGIRDAKLDGYRLLSKMGDPEKVIYSMTLFEKEDGVNKLRVQTDTFDQPFNINEGVKLDLGSTAKFRTIITYLEVIEEIFQRYAESDQQKLKLSLEKESDPLSKWVIQARMRNPQAALSEILEQAMERTYSASPGERFFTAGGMHTFENFNKEDNVKTVTVSHALRHSINLPFIRLMRDIVRYFSMHTPGSSARTLQEMSKETRTEYLEKFADKEGRIFLSRFYEKYRDADPEQILGILMDSVKKKPSRFASIYWFIFPERNLEDFIAFMKQYVDHASLSEKELKKYFEWYSVRAQTLGDKGYLARMHPLELWTAGYLYTHPGATLSDILSESRKERIEVYDWLMKTSRKHAQDSRIRIILEAEAFTEIHQRWKKLGYPLPSLVPSLATSLGTSADRPDALAELMGIVLAEGMRYPKSSLSRLTFGKDTPYESTYEFTSINARRVLSTEVAQVAKKGLLDIVSHGTAIRLKDGIRIGGEVLPVGGKTGTGDHRYVVYRGGVKEKRVVNRTATFMFTIGDRYFGVISAFVPGREAGQFGFTSALPVQILKNLAPVLENLKE
jgi:membrane peptidoglycan carboxypeptidase